MASNNQADSVIVEKEAAPHVWLISLHRPDRRNAVDGPTAEKLAQAFMEFEQDQNARVAILYGRGGVFCSGADLKALSNKPELSNRLVPMESNGQIANQGIEPSSCAKLDSSGPMGVTRMLLSKPTIACISGYCVAGGLELACWCDLRICDETAKFGVLCRRWGVPLIDGGTVRLPMLIGLSRAMDLILTGRLVSAEEAYAIGLVNRLVRSPSELLPAALSLASTIASYPQQCLRTDRMSTLLRTTDRLPEWWNAMQAEFERGQRVIASESISGAKRFAIAREGRGGSGAPQGTTISKL